MAKAPKLKVYLMPAGFSDAIVAAASQKAALKAWGTTTDLFAAGRAWIVEDDKLVAEALARPGQVIQKPRGSEEAFLGPEPLKPFTSSATAKTARSVWKAARPPRKPKPQPPDRSNLDATEKDLSDLEAEIVATMGKFATERAELDRREDEARRSGEARIEELRRDYEKAASAYRNSGGL